MKTVKPFLVALTFAASAPFAISAHAQAMDHSKMDRMPASMSEGEVRKIDKEAKKITLKHGDIKNLDMPAMTMVFNVRDKAMLGQVKAGDTVKFKAVNEAGKFTVTDLEVVR
ncbi:MAG: copper-binding protein [Piscinibacter sp.]|nr:copper-binding protein [Piscinibacter sp.]MCW5663753.1 copper-binding protein [Piscinibacter sp.]